MIGDGISGGPMVGHLEHDNATSGKMNKGANEGNKTQEPREEHVREVHGDDEEPHATMGLVGHLHGVKSHDGVWHANKESREENACGMHGSMDVSNEEQELRSGEKEQCEFLTVGMRALFGGQGYFEQVRERARLRSPPPSVDLEKLSPQAGCKGVREAEQRRQQQLKKGEPSMTTGEGLMMSDIEDAALMGLDHKEYMRLKMKHELDPWCYESDDLGVFGSREEGGSRDKGGSHKKKSKKKDKRGKGRR